MFNHLSRITVVCLSVAAMASAAEPVKLPEKKEKIPYSIATLEMVKIPAGNFTVNRGGTSETVEIKSVWIAKHEVTWDAYDSFRLAEEFPTEAEKIKAREAKTHPSTVYQDHTRGFGNSGYPAVGIHYEG